MARTRGWQSSILREGGKQQQPAVGRDRTLDGAPADARETSRPSPGTTIQAPQGAGKKASAARASGTEAVAGRLAVRRVTGCHKHEFLIQLHMS